MVSILLADGEGLNSAEVGWQHNIDLGIFYETDKLQTPLQQFLMLTDEKNFGAVNPVYGNSFSFHRVASKIRSCISK